MFRRMRRDKQLLSGEETVAVLDRCSHGVLACLGDDGYPYAVPVNYVYWRDRIYFHCAKSGHKIDAIINHPKVSFAIIDEDTIVSHEYTSYYRSVIAFGQARFAVGEEWKEAFWALVEKYSGDQPQEAKEMEITGCTRTHIVAIDVEHLTGKVAKGYVSG